MMKTRLMWTTEVRGQEIMREEILSPDYKGNTGTGKALAAQYQQLELSWNPGKET